MRNIFDQYSLHENKLTHSLVSCLYEDKHLLNSFLKNFCPNFFNKKSNLKIEQQTVPGESHLSSDENERNYIKMNNTNGDELILVQIAGLIARRIVCDVKENDETTQGDRFGMIRFGSRVDLYFENYQLMVQKNQKTVGGETIIAKKN